MSTSEDDDDEGGCWHKFGFACIMEASVIDDWGISGAILDRIMGNDRPWSNSRSHNRDLGCDQDLHSIKMACQKARTEVLPPMPDIN